MRNRVALAFAVIIVLIIVVLAWMRVWGQTNIHVRDVTPIDDGFRVRCQTTADNVQVIIRNRVVVDVLCVGPEGTPASVPVPTVPPPTPTPEATEVPTGTASLSWQNGDVYVTSIYPVNEIKLTVPGVDRCEEMNDLLPVWTAWKGEIVRVEEGVKINLEQIGERPLYTSGLLFKCVVSG